MDEIGETKVEYEAGIEIPSAIYIYIFLKKRENELITYYITFFPEIHWCKSLRFKNFCAPSKHSGESSLSPNEPKSSLISRSA